MVNENEIVFITTSLYTKWLKYQQNILRTNFPSSDILVVDGRSGWPRCWFKWIDAVTKTDKKYYVHIDEDFFLTSKTELMRAISKMERDNIGLYGCADGYNKYRRGNPIALNSFLMIGKVEYLRNIKDLKSIGYSHRDGWVNTLGIKMREEHKRDFDYKFEIMGGSNFDIEYEAYYAFFWELKDQGCKFEYMYPYFDDRFKSINPRLEENSDDIGIHMWYTRTCDSDMDVFGIPNNRRYELVEEYLINSGII